MPLHSIPNIELNEYSTWEGKLTLNAWQGYHSPQGAYASLDSNHLSTGLARLTVDRADQPQTAPTPEQVNAYYYVITHQEKIRDALLQSLLEEYQILKGGYGYNEEEAAELMPAVHMPSDFKNLIGLSSVHISYVQKEGIAYVGYEFGCTWDDEHGLDIMTHRERVIEIGGADTSFLWWVADKDAKGENT